MRQLRAHEHGGAGSGGGFRTAPEQGQETHNAHLSDKLQCIRLHGHPEAARLVLLFLLKLDQKPVELALHPDSEL